MMTTLPDGLAAVIEEDHSALDDFMRGNPEPKKRIYSRGDDATLANQGQQFAGSDERHDFDVRVPTIFTREPVGWRIVHRHADGITTARPVESVLQR